MEVYFHSYKEVIYYWDIVKSFISRWEELKEKMKAEAFPFLFEISTSGFKKIDMDQKGNGKKG